MNYTKNYQLPQWVETDRIIMGDFNQAMADIDAGILAAAQAASSAQETAGGVTGAQATADAAAAAAAQAQSTANAAKTAAQTAQTTADTARSEAAAAQATADSAVALATADKLVIGSFTQTDDPLTISIADGARLGLFWSSLIGTTVAVPGKPGRLFMESDWESYISISMTSSSITTSVTKSTGFYTIYYAIVY